MRDGRARCRGEAPHVFVVGCLEGGSGGSKISDEDEDSVDKKHKVEVDMIKRRGACLVVDNTMLTECPYSRRRGELHIVADQPPHFK
jgi:hypothetical protein